MERKISITKFFIGLFIALLLTSCSGDVKQSMGLGRKAPDEFKVISNAPLSVPPDYTLRPPVPGARRPQEDDLNTQARELLASKEEIEYDPQTSKGEQVFLQRAGAQNIDSSIRQELDEQDRQDQVKIRNTNPVSKFFTYIRGEDVVEQDPVVNAAREKERITQNQEEGKPVNEGEVKVVGKEKKGLLNRVFNF